MKKHFDYCYIAGMHGDATVPIMDKFYKKEGCSFAVITENFSDHVEWLKLGIHSIFIYDQHYRQNNNQEVYNEIKRYIFSKLSIENLIVTEYMYYKTPRFFLRRKVNNLLFHLDGLFNEYYFETILQKPGGEILRRIFFNLSDTRFLKNNICFGESYLNGKSVLYQGEFKEFVKIEKNIILPDEEIKKLIFQSFGKKEFTYTSPLPKPKKSKISVLKDLFNAKSFNIIYSYFSIRLRSELIGWIRRVFLTPLYINDLTSIKNEYFFFPLNVQAESELFVRNYLLAKQGETLKKLVALVPDNRILLVKEHPGYSKSLGVIESYLLWLKGVRFLNPKMKSLDAITASEGVIAVSSTVLIESIVHEKPILILGEWSYGRELLNRGSEFTLRHIQTFFVSLQDYKVDKIDFFRNLLTSHAVDGIGYKGETELLKYLSAITAIIKREKS